MFLSSYLLSSLKVNLKFESSKLPIRKNAVINLVHQYNLHPSAVVNLRKRNKFSLTVLSSPHVHKKAREQFCISHFCSFFCFDLSNVLQYHNFLSLKPYLIKTFVNNGFQISFHYTKKEKIALTQRI